MYIIAIVSNQSSIKLGHKITILFTRTTPSDDFQSDHSLIG